MLSVNVRYCARTRAEDCVDWDGGVILLPISCEVKRRARTREELNTGARLREEALRYDRRGPGLQGLGRGAGG